MKWYVYGLIDPRTDKIFYIGKGQGRRMYAHETKGYLEENRNPGKCRLIREIHAASFLVTKQEIAYFYSESDAYEYERELIHSISGLTNLTKCRPHGVTEATNCYNLITKLLKVTSNHPLAVALKESGLRFSKRWIRRINVKYGAEIWQHVTG